MTWEAHAACHPDNRPASMTAAQWTGLFFPPQGGDCRPAKAICQTCPVQAECNCLANSTPFERDGVWGGQSGRERRASRRTGRTGVSYDAELREKGLRLYDQGFNYAQISERLGVPAQTPGELGEEPSAGNLKAGVMILIVCTLVAFVVGLAVESHWCGHRHQARRQEARNALLSMRVGQWMRSARYWHLEYEREKRTAESHAAMLAALGRAVAEGQSVNEGEVHEPNP